MNNVNPDLPPPVPIGDLIPCHLTYHRITVDVCVNKKQIFKFKPDSLLGVYIRIDLENLDLENKKLFQGSPFLAFQMRVTSDFEIEQMGDGFPCKDEARAKEIIQIIEAKNIAVPRVVLASWAGHFGLVTATNIDISYEELVLHHFYKPQKSGKQLCGFSLRHFRRCLGKPGEMIKEVMLPTTDSQIAEKMLKERSGEFLESKPQKYNQSPNELEALSKSRTLGESQLLVLSKAFPESVKFLQKKEKSPPQEVYDAFKRDVFALTGKTEEQLLLNQNQFEELTKRIRKNQRNKQKGIDPIEYELVGGWFFKGYANMTPEQRGDALKKLGLNPPSSGAITKICLRLKLPRVRKPGKH